MAENARIAEYQNAAAMDDPRMKGWGFLCLAGSHQYGRNDTTINKLMASNYYDKLLDSDAFESDKAKGAGRYAMLLAGDKEELQHKFGKFLTLCDLAIDSDETDIKLYVLKHALIKLIYDDTFPNDPIRANRYFEVLIEEAKDDLVRGDAAFRLACCLEIGKAGFTCDLRRAAELYKQVLDYDDPDSEPHAAVRLATMLMRDSEIGRIDYKQAKNLYERALRSDRLSGEKKKTPLFNLGIILIYGGYGTLPDPVKAQEVCEQLEKLGHPRVYELKHALDRKTGKVLEFVGGKALESFLSDL